jgi:hypothetical protein
LNNFSPLLHTKSGAFPLGMVSLLFFQEIYELQPRDRPYRCLQTFTNELALYLDPCKIRLTADILKQMRHAWERPPSPVFEWVIGAFFSIFARLMF